MALTNSLLMVCVCAHTCVPWSLVTLIISEHYGKQDKLDLHRLSQTLTFWLHLICFTVFQRRCSRQLVSAQASGTLVKSQNVCEVHEPYWSLHSIDSAFSHHRRFICTWHSSNIFPWLCLLDCHVQCSLSLIVLDYCTVYNIVLYSDVQSGEAYEVIMKRKKKVKMKKIN